MNSIRIALAAAGLIIAVVLQSTLLASLTPQVRPNLLLAATAAIGLNRGPWPGGLTGLCAGLMADMLTGRLVGLGMLTTGVAGFVAGLLGRWMFREHALVPPMVGIMATITDHVLFLVGVRAFGVNIPFRENLLRVTWPSIWYNGLLTALSFLLVSRLQRWIDNLIPSRHGR